MLSSLSGSVVTLGARLYMSDSPAAEAHLAMPAISISDSPLMHVAAHLLFVLYGV